jgi:hypothetical protein
MWLAFFVWVVTNGIKQPSNIMWWIGPHDEDVKDFGEGGYDTPKKLVQY